jgi:hypothetical protein
VVPAEAPPAVLHAFTLEFDAADAHNAPAFETQGWAALLNEQYEAPCRHAVWLEPLVHALAGGAEHPVPVNPQPAWLPQLLEFVFHWLHVAAEGIVHAVPVNPHPEVCVHDVSFVLRLEQVPAVGALQGVVVEYWQ